jgi:tetratricopeptide (TPR) repeat protein
MTRQMLTPVLAEAALGFFVDNLGQFGHNGADEGFQALLTMNAESGKGAVIMVNSDNGIAVAGLLIQSIAKEYGWNYKNPDQVFSTLVLIAQLKGAQAALNRYTEFKKSGSAQFRVDEETLNDVGYTLLSSGRTQDAIAILQRNVDEYPTSANVYDSLGEAYMKAGQRDLARQNYERSLQLDPKSQNATNMLQRLNEMK